MTQTKSKSKPQRQSGADMFAALAGTKTASKSKSKMPIVVVTNSAEIKQLIAIAKAKAAETVAKQKSALVQDKFHPIATKKWESRCQDDGTLYSSIKLTADLGGKSHSLTFTQKAQCKKMEEPDVSDQLHTIFGDEYDDHFSSKRMITIDTSALDDKQITAVILGIQKALKFADDPAKYKAAIGVQANVIPKDAFYRDRVLNPDFRKLACRAAEDDLAVPHMASFKL